MSKFFGVNSDYIKNNVYSLKTYKGATKVAGKIKFGGAENVANQFVIDAIDIDWGGLSLTSIYDKGTTSAKGTKNIELHKIDSNDENQNRDEIGISSTGYALAKLSDSFTYIVGVIGAQDTDAGTVRKRVADLEASVHTLTGGSSSSINDVVNKINRIEQELTENPNVSDWVTWVDSLKAFEKGTNVKKYIDDANGSLSGRINSKADASTVGGISTRVGTLETTVGNASSGLVKKVADLETNKANASTVSSLIDVVYQNGNTSKPSYIQAYAIPAYNIAWENKTAIENLKTSGISATRMVDADGNGILVFKSLSTD